MAAAGPEHHAAMRAGGRAAVDGCTTSRCAISAENLELMRLLDEQYTRTPFYGSRRMTAWLRTPGACGEPQAGARGCWR